jgi:hypothetical protein
MWEWVAWARVRMKLSTVLRRAQPVNVDGVQAEWVEVGYRGHHLVGYGATCCSLKHVGVLHRRGPKARCMGAA